MNKLYLPAIVVALFGQTVFSQDLISSTFVRTYSKSVLQSSFGFPAKNDVKTYKILYTSPDAFGVTDTLSGLLAIPDVAGPLAMVCYQHGTTNGKFDCPSRLKAGSGSALQFAAETYIALAPDFLGMGDSRGFHPYLHAASEAWAATDMIKAVLEFLPTTTTSFNDELFVTGYSQGGHASMALHREIEQDATHGLTITAAAHMSGPYSLSGATFENVILTDQSYAAVAYLPYVVMGFQAAYGDIYNELEDIFLPEYVPDIEAFREGRADLFTLNLALLQKLFQNHGNTAPKNMLQPDVFAELEARDTTSRLYQAVLDNDVFDWVPQRPTRLYYCEADEQVPYQNSIVTEQHMNQNGAPDVVAESKGANLTHGGCASPATLSTIEFFNSYRTSVSTKEVVDVNSLWKAAPNPFSDEVTVVPGDLFPGSKLVQLTISNVDGTKMYEQMYELLNGEITVNTSHWPSGIYFFQVFMPESGFKSNIKVVKP